MEQEFGSEATSAIDVSTNGGQEQWNLKPKCAPSARIPIGTGGGEMNEMKDIAVRVMNFLKRYIGIAWVSALRPVLGHVNWFFLVVLAIIAISSICLVLTHICLEFKKVPPGILQCMPNLILWFFGTDSTQLSLGGHYAIIIADMIAICAFVFAVLPWIQGVLYKIRIKRDIQEKFGFEFIPVKEQGKDDLIEMLKRYKGADHLTIFCGAFDWLGENDAMREEIVKLANSQKLKLSKVPGKYIPFTK